jgi:hypothetical protein
VGGPRWCGIARLEIVLNLAFQSGEVDTWSLDRVEMVQVMVCFHAISNIDNGFDSVKSTHMFVTAIATLPVDYDADATITTRAC